MKLYADYEHASISMVIDEAFREVLMRIIQEHRIQYFFESGTFNGLGSTTLISETIQNAGIKNPVFYTLERDPHFYSLACDNLKKFPFVKVYNGLSVDEKEAVKFLENDDFLINHQQHPDIYIDNLENPKQFYLNEISGNLSRKNISPKAGGLLSSIFSAFSRKKTETEQQNLIETLLADMRNTKPLILLDSAGGIGYLEFSKVREVMGENPFFIILDDTHHIKHWRSRRDVLTDNRFSVIHDDTTHGRIIASWLI
jgi:hypothetical protein